MKDIQLEILDFDQRLMNLKEASRWATNYVQRNVTISNISYLIQYGRINRYNNGGATMIDQEELKSYYDKNEIHQQHRNGYGDKGLNWNLSFTEFKESERTKHVHRLHPYKGKFIPQLVEYFLDNHTDQFKKNIYFQPGDVILDPFCGSGTTLIQANELGLHALGVDISAFNTMISNVKLADYNLIKLKQTLDFLSKELMRYCFSNNFIREFDDELTDKLTIFNNMYFPSPKYKRDVREGIINEKEYAQSKAEEFKNIYLQLVEKYNIELEQNNGKTFLDVWYLPSTRAEIDLLFQHIKNISDLSIKKIAAVILSRTIRSCRATTHADLGTLKSPVKTTYYCRKHGKICKPLFSLLTWWNRYTKDTLTRLLDFSGKKTKTTQICFTGDSRNIDIFAEVEKKIPSFSDFLKRKKISGIFSSPPYVGLIDYHEQHAYAYDLFGFERRDEKEIGPLFKGKGKEAQKSYVRGISDVLNNSKRFLADDYNVFLVANDQFNLYNRIAELSGMKIVNKYKRPVLNRVEKNRSAYSEIIFHLKEI
jgi:DNA modification methylase